MRLFYNKDQEIHVWNVLNKKINKFTLTYTLSLSVTHKHTHNIHTLTLSLYYSHKLSYSQSNKLTFSHSQYFNLFHTLTLTHSLSQSSHFHTFTLSHILTVLNTFVFLVLFFWTVHFLSFGRKKKDWNPLRLITLSLNRFT
jgi:hypothetical protein